MRTTVDIKRTGFYTELPPMMRKQCFRKKQKKTIHMIDNIYYTVFVTGDSKEHVPLGLQKLLDELENKKLEAIAIREPIVFEQGLYYLLKTYSTYGYCVGSPDLYDIFYCKSLPNDDTPRIMVQIRAFGLWTRGIQSVLDESYAKVDALLSQYSCTVDWCRESRIDYCFHTNAISSPNRLFKEDAHGKVKHLHTNLKNATWNADIEHEDDGTVFIKDYLCFGRIKSNNVRARVYNKVKEVIEMGYKGFFFDIWHKNGLISYYDKCCMEYAFTYKNMDYLAKGALDFYVKHGIDQARIKKYSDALNNPKTTLAQFKALAAEHMPKVTTILNIEYETKRKFYYHSDNFINGFKLSEQRGNIAKPMERIYKILEYREVFLDYLTGKTLSFYNGHDEKGEPKFLDWWKRLRNTKHDGKKVDFNLVREYSQAMDRKAVQKRVINSLASVAVYDDNLETDFLADISDLLADVSDNQAHKMGINIIDSDGYLLDDVNGSMIANYKNLKAKKEILLKNRKARIAAQAKEDNRPAEDLKQEFEAFNKRLNEKPLPQGYQYDSPVDFPDPASEAPSGEYNIFSRWDDSVGKLIDSDLPEEWNDC